MFESPSLVRKYKNNSEERRNFGNYARVTAVLLNLLIFTCEFVDWLQVKVC